MTYLIEVVKKLYNGSGIPELDAIMFDWKGLILPIQSMEEIEKANHDITVLHFGRGQEDEKDFFLVRREDLLNALRFQKKNDVYRTILRSPFDYFGFSPACCSVFVKFEDVEFSEKDLIRFAELRFRLRTDLSMEMLVELYEVNGFNVEELGSGKFKVIENN